MQANPLLSIVIPTYNRAAFLDYCLETHIPLAKAHNIQIFISDNASTDATKAVAEKRVAEYPLIRYYCNETNVGPDGNFEKALKYPQSEYVWLLGDTCQIPYDGISYILNLITPNKEKYDAIILNVARRVLGIPQQDYFDQNELLSDLGWHMTCMSSLVFSSRIIAHSNFKRYLNTNFVQLGVILEYIADKEFHIHWAEALSVQAISVQGFTKVSWQDQTFEIWAKRWTNFIFSLPPSYKLEIKIKCIKDHSLKSNVFCLKSLLNLRIANILNIKICQKYLPYLYFIDIKSNLSMFTIALIPRKILQVIKAIIKA